MPEPAAVQLMLLMLALVAPGNCQRGAAQPASRKPRIFYISSSTTTSTVTTNTVCFVTTDTAATACSGKSTQ